MGTMRYDFTMAITWDEGRPGRVAFTVYRGTWSRGVGEGTSLLSEDGRRCCLGHLARDLGVPDADVRLRAFVPRVRFIGERRVDSPAAELYLRIAKGAAFVSVNDNPDIPDEEREALLTEMFADAGADVAFVDGDG